MTDKCSETLIITHDPIFERMGGIGVRYFEIAKALSKSLYVNLVSIFPEKGEKKIGKLTITGLDGKISLLKKFIDRAKVILIPDICPEVMEMVINSDKPVAVGLTPSLIWEDMERTPWREWEEIEARNFFQGHITNIKERLLVGDFFYCAGERERDFYLGALAMMRRIPFTEYDKDKKFQNIIDVVPYGIPDEPPCASQKVLKGVMPGIEEDDFLLIWHGGVWNWNDPVTLIKAIKKASHSNPNIRLFFTCSLHPAESEPHKAYKETVKLCEKEGLLNKFVFFNQGWIPYNKRVDYLLEADAGVFTHFDNIETHYSTRVRLADHFWAYLPSIITEGNDWEEKIKRDELGIVVKYGDVKGLEEAILKLAADKNLQKKIRGNIGHIRKGLYWERAVEPLLRFCLNPKKTPRPCFAELYPLPVGDMMTKDIRKILFIRSSTLEHSKKGIRLLQRLFPDAAIDLVLQPEVQEAFKDMGDRINIITTGNSAFDPLQAENIRQHNMEGKKYDLALFAFSSKFPMSYLNVMAFLKHFPSKIYGAYSPEDCLVDIHPFIYRTPFT